MCVRVRAGVWAGDSNLRIARQQHRVRHTSYAQAVAVQQQLRANPQAPLIPTPDILQARAALRGESIATTLRQALEACGGCQQQQQQEAGFGGSGGGGEGFERVRGEAACAARSLTALLALLDAK